MGDILEHIWSGTLEQRTAAEFSPLARIFSSLLAAPTLCLTAQGAGKAPIASFGGQEVMPGASLADVLDQELGIEITDETIVLVEPREMSEAASYSGQELGQTLGALLVALSGQAQPAPDAVNPAQEVNLAGQNGRRSKALAESHIN